MSSKADVLRQVMRETRTKQSELARISGVHQPSISGFLHERVDLSDEKLDRLLSCMGFRLEVHRRRVAPDLTRSEERSWRLHRQLAVLLSLEHLEDWRPVILRNLERLVAGVTGQPHTRNLERWGQLLDQSDLSGLRHVLTGLDRGATEMREVSPLGGLLSDEQRLEALGATR